MKKIIFILLTILIVFIIYIINKDNSIYYLSIGDNLSYGINNKELDNTYNRNIKKLKKYINYTNTDDYRVMDLINDINYNKEIIYKNKKYKLQNLLIKSNLITLSIGMDDLIYKNNINKEYADELLNDIENLFKLIRKYNKDKIYMLSFYNLINNNNIIIYLNNNLKQICKENKINYVDISNLKKYISYNTNITQDGYNYIIESLLKN